MRHRKLFFPTLLLLAGCASAPIATPTPAPHAPSPAATPTQTPVHKTPPYRPTIAIGGVANNYSEFVNGTGVAPSIEEGYIRVGKPFGAHFAGPAEPLIEISKGVSLKSIAHGDQDAWLISYANQVKAYSKPVIIGFAPEFNGSWYNYGLDHASPTDYVNAYQLVVSVFKAQGAVNVKWLWDISVAFPQWHGPTNSTTLNVKPWWPGSQYVDYIGIDGYYYNQDATFASLFAPAVNAVRSFGKPTFVAEAGAPQGPKQAGNIVNLVNGARQAGMFAVVYFDLKGNKDWRITTPAAIAAFKGAIK